MTSATIHCARHPGVETGLRCGRCETPICPRCMVMTDVGARCPQCAPRRKLPQFEVGPLYLLRGAAAALAVGAALGALWGALLPDVFGLLEVLAGLGVGFAVGEGVSWATNRKYGTALQVAAAAGVVGAYLLRNVVAGDAIVPANNLYGYVAVGVGVAFAFNRLRA